jgi:hypothetical protein
MNYRICRIEIKGKNRFYCSVCKKTHVLDIKFDKAECCGQDCVLEDGQNLFYFHRWGEGIIETSDGDTVQLTIAILENTETGNVVTELPENIKFLEDIKDDTNTPPWEDANDTTSI